MAEIKELIHNGVMIPEIPYLKLTITIEDKTITLNPIQEQMAIAWVRKLSTIYVEDPIFCENFFEDFSEALGNKKQLTDEEIDFSKVIEYIEEERVKRESITKEEKKEAREQRKIEKERLKEIYGSAILDGQKVEISNWTAEPSSIFMGRGEHPMRGKWKEGPIKADITLNLSSSDHLKDKNEWKEIIWEPSCLWIAKWDDKLSQKAKYVWLADTTPIKQDREIEKFDKSKLVGENLEQIRKGIEAGIQSKDEQIRKVALACYIIDRLNMRVGDEKDEDEADTVGATTLRPEHITFNGEKVRFNFLGKDSVEWNKELEFPQFAIDALKELITKANNRGEDKPQIFDSVGSRHVNDFLGDIVEGLTAKVFRTYHASNTVSTYLNDSDVTESDPDYFKKEIATMANREAAIVCNHMKQEPKNWDNRMQKFRERKMKAEVRIEKAKTTQKEKEVRLEQLKANLQEKKNKEKEQLELFEEMKSQLNTLKVEENHQQEIEKLKKKIASQKKKVESAKRNVETATNQVEKAKNTVGTAKERVYKAKEAYNMVESQHKIAKSTKVWNLGTSMKSYIDPRVYYDWGKEVDYDWKNYYSSALQKKFSWLERDEDE